MASLQIDTTHAPGPTTIPPRTSSHGVAFVSQPETSSASAPLANLSGNVSPPHRRSSKRPVSTTSENWLAQSSGKKPLTAQNLSSDSAAARADKASRRHSHSHRPKSAHATYHHSKLLGPHLEHMGPTPPPQSPLRTIGDEYIQPRHAVWPADKEKILLGPFDYLYGHPGKDIRSQLIASFNEWLRVPDEKLAVITKVVGMLHTASLLVDDVEDSSLLRRGVPVAHSIFGVPQVINSANYVYFLALQELSTLNNPTAIKIFTDELLNLHRGQGMDLYWRDSLTCPTESEYLEMVSNKTGGLFRLAIQLMQTESSVASINSRQSNTTPQEPNTTAGATASSSAAQSPPAAGEAEISCVPLINTIGLLFQILDDYLNLASPEYTARKGHAEDLTEGKFSFPVVHAIRSDPSNLVLLNVLRQKTTDLEVKRYAVEYMDSMGSFEYTKRVIAELEKKAVREVGRLEARIGGDAGKSGAERIRVVLGKLKAL